MRKPLVAKRQAGRAIDDRFARALDRAEGFFMKTGKVHRAMSELARRLDEAEIPYAIADAMALNAHGYQRVTTDIDILLTREGLTRFKTQNLGRGTSNSSRAAKGFATRRTTCRSTSSLPEEFPGDGKPKPIAFPDPEALPSEGDRFRIMPLNTLLELKLASGMTAAHRLKDLADVLQRNDPHPSGCRRH